MTEELELILNEAEESMGKAVEHLRGELTKIRAGKANPQMLEGIQIEYYGSTSPLQHVASVSAPDARTLTVQPWEKQLIGPIEKAIMGANLGLNPQNDGQIIRINLPILTEERRKELVKMAKGEAEDAKISIRSIRKDANEDIRKEVKEGLAEDEAKRAEEQVQQLTDSYAEKIDQILASKEKEITTV